MALSAPTLTAPPGFALWSLRRASTKGACPPPLILGAGAVFVPPGSGENLPQFDVRFDTGDEGRGLVYLPPLPENGQAFCSLPLTKPPPVFLPVQAGRESDAPRFPRQPRQQV